ncbi:MAG: hypothetical protein NZ578_12750 [Candidatus Binatia bacterium]|nr:hypothetical protein [Candidatus Binatia bacterium]
MRAARHTVQPWMDCSLDLPQSFSLSDSLAEDDTIPLPLVQYSDTLSPSFFRRCPEVGLVYAVLQDALHCFRGLSSRNPRHARRLAREAEEWFFSDDVDWPFSFLNLCAMLGLDPSYIRAGLRRWRQSSLQERRRKTRRTVPALRPLRIAA